MSHPLTTKPAQDRRANSKRPRSDRRRKLGGRTLRLEGLENRSMLSVSACILVAVEGENPMWQDGALEQDVSALVAAEQVSTPDTNPGVDSAPPAERVEAAADVPGVDQRDALPAPRDDAFAMTDDQQLGGSVLANDLMADGQEPVTVVVEGPQHGTLTLGSNGLFTYTPDRGFSGTDTFAYRVAGSQEVLIAAAQAETAEGDGQDATVDGALGTVTIVVESTNEAAVAVDDSYTVDEDQTLVINAEGLLANDTDSDGDALTAVLVGAPAHGTVMLRGDGTFEYTPNANFFGSDSFAYAANDGVADSEPAVVDITVNAVNDAPRAEDDSYTVREDETLVAEADGVLTNDTDIDGDTLTAVVVDQPQHGTVTLAEDGSFEYTPDANYHGSDSFTYAANDGSEDSSPAVVEITVTPIDLTIQLQVSEDSFAPGMQSAWAGSTFWVSAYVQDLRDAPLGVVGGAIDILFDSQLVAPTGNVVYGQAFDLFQQGVADGENGQIDETGAISTALGVGVDGLAPFVAWEFVSLAQPSEAAADSHVQFVVELGQGTETVTPADFALIGSGEPVAPEQISLKNAEVDLYFADLNLDGAVDHFDLALWQPHADTPADSPSYDPLYDLNADQAIDALDLDLLTAVMYQPTTWDAVDADADSETPTAEDESTADTEPDDPLGLESIEEIV